MSWFNSLSSNVQAAVIGALVALIGILLKDLVIARWQERKKREQDQIAVFQKYADPLSSAATGLLWRLNEVFSKEGRGAYLKADAPPNTYNNYKKVSTLYRLASLIGWIRAFRRELSYLRVQDQERFQYTQDAIHEFETALADGPQVELECLDLLAKLWCLNLPTDESQRATLAVDLEHSVHRSFHNERVNDDTDVPFEVKERICAAVVAALSTRLQSMPPSADLINKTILKAYEIFTIKETWFYRDWQIALGDIMIEQVSGSSRRFDIIGFGEFESIWSSQDEGKKVWLSRLNGIMDDLDVSLTDDCRVAQLQKIFEATARLVRALANISTSREIISEKTINLAEDVLTHGKSNR